LPWLIREFAQNDKVTILTYHSPTPESARRHFEVLRRHYHVISLKDYLGSRMDGSFAKLPPKSLILTFDDGHRNNIELSPLFQEFKIPATIFLCSGIVGTHRHFWWRHVNSPEQAAACKRLPDAERLKLLLKCGYVTEREYPDRDGLSDAEITELSQCVDFQAHTVSHPILPVCSDEVAAREIAQCKNDLETKYGLNVYALAFPNGDYSARELFLARKYGYRCALTQDPGFNDEHTDVFRLCRIAVRDECSIDELLVKACGLWGLISHWAGRRRNQGPVKPFSHRRQPFVEAGTELQLK